MCQLLVCQREESAEAQPRSRAFVFRQERFPRFFDQEAPVFFAERYGYFQVGFQGQEEIEQANECPVSDIARQKRFQPGAGYRADLKFQTGDAIVERFAGNPIRAEYLQAERRSDTAAGFNRRGRGKPDRHLFVED